MTEVEKVARAMCKAGGYDPDEMMPNDGPRWRYYVPGAEAALAAADTARGESADERQAAIVAWLREQPKLVPLSRVHVRQNDPQMLAAEIESGEWRR